MDGETGFDRTLILGNSGSGKSWLSARLAEARGVDAIDLDSIHWEPGGYNAPREKRLAISMVRQMAARPAWVIEGVYGWLAQEAGPRATALIWLDIPVGECIGNLRRREVRDGEDEASLEALLAWAADYPHRRTSSSFAGHERLFATFPRLKLRLASRRDVDHCLAEIGSSRLRPAAAPPGQAPPRSRNP